MLAVTFENFIRPVMTQIHADNITHMLLVVDESDTKNNCPHPVIHLHTGFTAELVYEFMNNVRN